MAVSLRFPWRRASACIVRPWDGHAVADVVPGSAVVVLVPVRLVAMRHEVMPPGPVATLAAAVRLQAPRRFAALGPVVVDALLTPGSAFMVALPHAVVEAIRTSVTAAGGTLAGIRVAEFQLPVERGGRIPTAEGVALVVRNAAGAVVEVVPVGQDAATEARERLRWGVADDAPAGPPVAPALDLWRPRVATPMGWWQRPAMRPLGLAAALLLVVAGGVGWQWWDALQARDAALAAESRAAPLAKTLAAQRHDLKEVARWHDERPSVLPILAAVGSALGKDGQVRLVRLRHVPGEATLAEGVAGDRGQMLAFVARLRQDRRIASAEIRAFRTPSKASSDVVFELAIVLRDGVTAGGADVAA